MKKENHNEEIRATRVGGFGGSDAAMVLAMADRIKDNQPLTTSQKHRMLQLKGLEECPTFDSPEIQAGRTFEENVAAVLVPQGWDRETYLTQDPNSSPAVRQHFKVFAHADFWNSVTNTVIEAKWSRKWTAEELKKVYMPQLQWYYMLGVDAVRLTCDTDEGCSTMDIARDDAIIASLENALETIDEAYYDINLHIEDLDDGELPPDVLCIKNEIAIIKRRMAEDDERLKNLNSELMHWMEEHQVSKVYGEDCIVIYTMPSTSVSFDAKKFEKDHPDTYAEYRTKITKKSGYLTVKIK